MAQVQRNDMHAPETDAALERNASLAQSFGFRGTPAMVVGGTVVVGPVTQAELEALIALERVRPPICS